MGLYLSSHPLDRYQAELAKLASCKVRDFATKSPQSLRIGGMIVAVRTLNTKRGDRMAVITLDDRTGRTDVPIFPEMFQNSRDLLEKDNIIIIEGDLQEDRFTGGQRFNTRSIMSFEKARQKFAKAIQLTLQSNEQTPQIISDLKSLLAAYKGGNCDILIQYQRTEAGARLNLGDAWKVQPTNELLEKLGKLLGLEEIGVIY